MRKPTAKHGGKFSPMLKARVSPVLKDRVTAARGRQSESEWIRAAALEKLARDCGCHNSAE